MERKILVAIGNTARDNTIISYLDGLFPDRSEVSLHLLNIVTLHNVAESQQLLGDPEQAATSSPASLKKGAEARRHLNDLQEKLRGAGFKDELIVGEVLFSYGSVSIPLLHHAQTGGYDAMVLAKRDLSLLEKMISGSISSELLRKNHVIPLWLVSGNPRTRNFLVPVDCSEHTLRAVDHLGFILRGDPAVEITLFHSCSLLAAENITPREKFHERWGREWCDQHLK
ncbi:MAG: universal stress protein, partial [Desulfobulbaceae bacterium]|nr:universal stress protein [Desulfobulbaceae bacterium]